MKDRLKKIRRDADLTQQEFADNIGSKRNTIATYEMGRTIPSAAVISLICREFGVNENWLRTGQGEPYIQKTRPDEIADFVNRIQTEDNPFKARLIQMLSKMTEEEWVLLEKMIDRMTEEQEQSENLSNITVEEAEVSYKKAVLNSAKNTGYTASSTTEDTDSPAVIG